MSLFGEFGFIPEPLLKMETQTRNLLPRVAFQRSIFGEGVLVSRSNEGLALISVVDGDNSVVQDVVMSVFNGSYFLDLHFEQHDKDLFYFVKVIYLYKFRLSIILYWTLKWGSFLWNSEIGNNNTHSAQCPLNGFFIPLNVYNFFKQL